MMNLTAIFSLALLFTAMALATFVALWSAVRGNLGND